MSTNTMTDFDDLFNYELPHSPPRSDDAGSVNNDTSSASESSGDHEAPPPVQKKRKSTYYQRKDEIEELQDQVKQLQDELARSKGHVNTTDGLREAHTLSTSYSKDIERNNLVLAGTQSMLSAYQLSLAGGAPIPLDNHIHLPVDTDARAAVLNAMRMTKMDSALRFISERSRCLDLRQKHCQIESFQLPNGDLVSTGFDVTQFDGGHSLKQVFDAFLFFISHQEMSISEKLGILTIRESEECDFFKFMQTRFLSSIPEGIEVESNVAMFATGVVPSTSSIDGKTPSYAMGVIDFVDQDDLYPYRPQTCGRKDITGVIKMTQIPTPGGGHLIAMSRWSYVRFRVPTFPMTKAQDAAVQKHMMDWCEIIPKAMKECLSMLTPVRELS